MSDRDRYNKSEDERIFTIGVNYEYSSSDFKKAFNELGLEIQRISHSNCYVTVLLPEKYGLLFVKDDASNSSQYYKVIKEELEKLNPNYEILQIIFEDAEPNVKVVLVTFSGKKGNSNIVCFKPSENDIFIKKDELKTCTKTFGNLCLRLQTHEFIN